MLGMRWGFSRVLLFVSVLYFVLIGKVLFSKTLFVYLLFLSVVKQNNIPVQ